MSRHLFIGGEVALAEQVDGSTKVDGGRAFTLWSDSVAGSDWTAFCTDTDGVTALVALTDVHGRLPSLLGPNAQSGLEVYRLYLDWGNGAPRTPWYADDRIGEVLAGSLGTATANTWAQLQTFDGGIAVPDGTLAIADVAGLQTALNNAGSGGGTTLTSYSQVSGLAGYPTSFPPNLGSSAMVPALTANQFLIMANVETSGGAYDPLPSNIPAKMIVLWVGKDDPASGTRANDMRYVLP